MASFWCTASLVVKLHHRLPMRALLRLSTGLTAAGFLPSGALLLWRPSLRGFLLSLLTTSVWPTRLQRSPSSLSLPACLSHTLSHVLAGADAS